MTEDSRVPNTSEVTKDILAPSEGPRENLITTAVKFLQNAKVQQSPLYQKKAFLENKGLTKEEIDLALKRAGVKDITPGLIQEAPYAHPPTTLHSFQPAVVPPPPPDSVWKVTRDLASTALIVTSVSYAVYRIFQDYIRPWLLGRPSDAEVRLQKMEEMMLAAEKTLATIQESLSQQQIQIVEMSRRTTQQSIESSPVGSSDTVLIKEVKSEVALLKGLLLSRRQFPPTPHTSPILPSWQLTDSSSMVSTVPSSENLINADQRNISDDISAESLEVSRSDIASDVQLSEHSLDDVPTSEHVLISENISSKDAASVDEQPKT